MQSVREGLIYVLIFGALLLIQHLIKRFGPQQQPQLPQDGPDREIPAQEQASLETSQEVPAVATASDMRFGRSDAPHASQALAVRRLRRFSRSALMGTRRDVRSAIVIATILGPCRAFEPHDSR
jgi:hypothetical protein